jgi:predicted DNA-binding transcriptional regulator AlpA
MVKNPKLTVAKSESDFREILAEIRKLRDELRTATQRLLPVQEAASYLGISPKTIRNGLGPKAFKPFPVKPVRYGGKVLFRREDLDRFIDEMSK